MRISRLEASLGVTCVIGALLIGWALGGAPAPERDGSPDETSAVAGAATPSAAPGGQAGKEMVAVVGPAQVIDTVTLRIGEKVVSLYGIEWAEGASAGDFAGYIAGRDVRCDPFDARSYRCVVGGQDLSRVVVFNGGARARFDAGPALKDAAENARKARRGIWADHRQ